MTMFGERRSLCEFPAQGAGWGTMRMWRRHIGEHDYEFALVLMPDGEVRYEVKIFNGYVGGPAYACAWDLHHQIVIKPKGKCRHCGSPTAYSWSEICTDCAASNSWWL